MMMELYNIFDFLTGIGCLVFACSFFPKKLFFLPERRTVFLFFVIGVGFILRGFTQYYKSTEFLIGERIAFTFLPLAATLYAEKICQLKLKTFFKFYILIGLVTTLASFLLITHSLYFSQAILTVYEVITLSYLGFELLRKIFKSEGVERSISITILIFSVITTAMLIFDYYRVNVLGQTRITAIIVFPFCYIAFLYAFSGEGFSIRKIFKSTLIDVASVSGQTFILIFVFHAVGWGKFLIIAVAFLYVRTIFKIFSLMINSTENKKIHFILEKINKLSKARSKTELLEEIERIDNIRKAKFVTAEDFRTIRLEKAFEDLKQNNEFFSRKKIMEAQLRPGENLDLNSISMMLFTLDAFEADYLYCIPEQDICLAIKMENVNLDMSTEERVYYVLTQVTLAVSRKGFRYE